MKNQVAMKVFLKWSIRNRYEFLKAIHYAIPKPCAVLEISKYSQIIVKDVIYFAKEQLHNAASKTQMDPIDAVVCVQIDLPTLSQSFAMFDYYPDEMRQDLMFKLISEVRKREIFDLPALNVAQCLLRSQTHSLKQSELSSILSIRFSKLSKDDIDLLNKNCDFLTNPYSLSLILTCSRVFIGREVFFVLKYLKAPNEVGN